MPSTLNVFPNDQVSSLVLTLGLQPDNQIPVLKLHDEKSLFLTLHVPSLALSLLNSERKRLALSL